MLERMVSLQTNRIAGETHEILLDLLSTLSIHIIIMAPIPTSPSDPKNWSA
jgi:hypothetical protein